MREFPALRQIGRISSDMSRPDRPVLRPALDRIEFRSRSRRLEPVHEEHNDRVKVPSQHKPPRATDRELIGAPPACVLKHGRGEARIRSRSGEKFAVVDLDGKDAAQG